MPLTLTAIIGNRVKLLRERKGTTQDDVANAARACGLPWGRSTIAELEAGAKRLSAEELILIPFMLLRAFDFETHLADLAIPMDTDPGDRWVTLPTEPAGRRVAPTPPARMTYTAIAEMLGGRSTALTTNPDDLDLPFAREQRRAQADAVERLKTYRPLWPGTSLHRLAEAERDAGGEAEQKAGRKLGVPAAHVAIAAHRLWGRGLTAERDRRVADQQGTRDSRSLQAVRGHVTRTLLAELRQHFHGFGWWPDTDNKKEA